MSGYRIFVGGDPEGEFDSLVEAASAATSRARRLTEHSGLPQTVEVRDHYGALIGKAHSTIKTTWALA